MFLNSTPFFDRTQKIRDGLIPVYLLVYRTIAFTVITGGLLFLFSWLWIMVFFMFSTTWIAPTVLSPTSDKMLTFEGGLLTVTGQQGAAQITYNTAVRQVEVLIQQRTELTSLRDKAELAFKTEVNANKSIISGANALISQRQKDVRASEALQSQLDLVRARTEEMLAAHLITRDTATQNLTAIQSFNNLVTDGKTSSLTLVQQTDELSRRQSSLLGSSKSVDAMIPTKLYADTQQALLQNANDLKTAEEVVGASKHQLDLATSTMENLKQTSYMAAQTAGSNLAFVAYDNTKVAKIGAPVYDCYLMIAICHRVGTIRHIYRDEEIIDFPLFNVKLSRTVRGFMVDMDVTNPSAMASSVLFVNKPMFF